MQSARVVVLIVAVACACETALGVATNQRLPARHTLYALLNAASGLANPKTESTHQNSLSHSYAGSGHTTKVSQGDEFSQESSQKDEMPASKSSLAEFSPRKIVWAKRSEPSVSEENRPYNNEEGQDEIFDSIKDVGASLTANFLRNARSQTRPYDVPQIECPPADDQMERFPCPAPDRMGRYRCIDDHVLCDGFMDCPDGEDEDRRHCMFYKTTKAHLDVIADAIIRFIRGRK